MTTTRRLRLVLLTALTVGLAGGCGDEQTPGATGLVDPGTPAPQASPSPTGPPTPLTGLTGTDPARSRRQAVAVPLRVGADTTLVGLDLADLVYQEYAEAGTLHLTAVYQSRDVPRIGPVTEIRPVDVRTLAVLRPIVGHLGGPTGFVRQLADAKLAGVTPAQRGSAFSDGYTSTEALYQAAPKGAPAPTTVFDHAGLGTPLAGQQVGPATELTIVAPGHPAQTWRYDPGAGRWTGQVGRARIAVTSIVVLTMPYRTLTVRRPSPRQLPGATVFGDGAAVVVSGSFSAPARWRKPGQDMVCNVTDLDGNQIRPLPGATWIVYAPPEARVTRR